MWPSTLQRGKRVQRPSGSACAQGVFESSTVCCFNTARLITLLQQLEVMGAICTYDASSSAF